MNGSINEAATARGRRFERIARRYLETRGLAYVAQNYRAARGEIDLIMRERDTLVFVEVRYRASARFGTAAETVGRDKQSRLRRAAEHYLQRYGTCACRFDVIAVTRDAGGDRIEWIRDAFA